MKEFKSFFILLLLALPALLAASAPAPVSSAALWTVDYEVCYKSRGLETKVADASVSLGNGTWDGQSVLHAHAVIHAASIFRLFMNAEYTADAYLAKGGGVEPLYYKNPVKRTGKFECIYDPSAKTVSTEFVRPPSDPVLNTIPLDGKTMDLLSLLQYVRFADIPSGSSQSMHVLKAGLSVPATLSSQGRDTERFPDQASERFLLELKEKGLLKGGFLKKNKADFSKLDKALFTKADKRQLSEIAIPSKSAKVMSGQPDNAYEVVAKDKQSCTLRITNKDRFWSAANLLIIEAK